MFDQSVDKTRYTLAIGLSLVVLLVWAFFFSEPVQERKGELADKENANQTEQTQSQTLDVTESPIQTEIGSPISSIDDKSNPTKTEKKPLSPSVEVKEIILKNDLLKVGFSSKNAIIKSSIITVEEGHNSLDLERSSHPSLQTGRVFFNDPKNFNQISDEYFQVLEQTENSITFAKDYQFVENEPPVRLIKKYTLENYQVHLDIEFQNLGANKRIKYYLINGSAFNGFNPSGNYFDIKQLTYNYGDEMETALSQGILDMFSTPEFDTKVELPTDWIGIDDRFYARLLKIDPKSQAQREDAFFFKTRVERDLVKFSPDEMVDEELVQSAMEKWFFQVGGVEMSSTVKDQFSFVYIPKKRDLLNQFFDEDKEYFFNLFHQYKIMRILSSMMYWVLIEINLIVGNFGWAILLMTFLLKLAIFPLTQKSMKSMQKMQLLGPKIEVIKKNNKKNPQKMNSEMMALYKKEGVNPLGGCLPMLVPLPIFISLYSLFQNMVELQGASFLWIKDLSLPDIIFTLDSRLPFIGSNIHLLPIIMVVSAFGQSLTTPTSSATSREAKQQQMMMKYFMPFFFFFISWNMPSALILYWTMQNTFSIAQSLIVKKSVMTETSETNLLKK